MMPPLSQTLLTLAALLLAATQPAVAAPLTPAQTAAIDDSVGAWRAAGDVPSVSIAVVTDGRLAYARAYGNARLSPDSPATTTTRYAVDSVSKAITATAVLLLAQQGRLRLDEPVSGVLPGLAGAGTVTIRQVLSHTAGFRDYWPQDYVPAEMLRPVTLPSLLDEWAKRKLDFAPGTDWQYSNTDYVVAGAIVQKLSGETLHDFEQTRIFATLHMDRVTQDDTAPLSAPDAAAYTRYGLGPVRAAVKEAPGWLFAASDLAMDPSTLARWDIGLLDRSLLSSASYDALFTPTRLRNGTDTGYGLGEEIEKHQGRLEISHDGAGSGFLAANAIWPTDRVAIVALTNNDWSSPQAVLDRIAFIVLPATPAEARARAVFDGFRAGTVDRTLFTANGNAYLTAAVLADQQHGLATIGPIRTFTLKSESLRGGLRTRIWMVATDTSTLRLVERAVPDGQIEQFMVELPG